MDDSYYYGSFEDEPLKPRVVRPMRYYLDDNYKPRDFSGNTPENEDYEVWKESY
jgi:hypothetical protein